MRAPFYVFPHSTDQVAGPEFSSFRNVCTLSGLPQGLPHGNWSRFILLGRKIVGDPNVPSGQATFMANMAVENPRTQPQPQATVYHSKGQINFFPARWDPEWVPATLHVWEQPRGPTFGLEWDEDGHVINYEKLEW